MAPKLQLPEPLQSLLGGIESGALTNFFGAPGTGKTNICLLLAIECVKNGGKVIYVDTEGGFSLERVMQLVPDAGETLKSITISEPRNFKVQGEIIRSLEKSDANLIIVDSAAALYRLEYADPEKEALARRSGRGPAMTVARIAVPVHRRTQLRLAPVLCCGRRRKSTILLTDPIPYAT